jgi:hypothetical protein
MKPPPSSAHRRCAGRTGRTCPSDIQAAPFSRTCSSTPRSPATPAPRGRNRRGPAPTRTSVAPAIGQGHGDEGRRFERGKVQRHEAEAVGFKADGHAGMGDRDGRIRGGRARPRQRDHRRVGGVGGDIQTAGQAEGAERGFGGLGLWRRRPGRREAAGGGVEGCGTRSVRRRRVPVQAGRESRARRRTRIFGQAIGLRPCERVGDRSHRRAGVAERRQGRPAFAAPGAVGTRSCRRGAGPPREVVSEPSSNPGRTPACAAKSAIAPPIRPSAPTRITSFLFAMTRDSSAI